MEKRISRNSAVALLCACVWTMIVLCLSMPARPAEKAHAAPNDMIEVYAVSVAYQGGSMEEENFLWGTFYCGIELLAESHYRVVDTDGNVETDGRGNKKEGTIDWANAEFDGEQYDLGTLEYDGVLESAWKQDQHSHDFTAGGNGDWEPVEEDTDNKTHWAVCNGCGLQLQVAHRPDADGNCMDCGAELGENYINLYTFTLPDEIPAPDAEGWTFEEGSGLPTYSFDITLEESSYIYEGFTLSLKIWSENGGLANDDKSIVIDYLISAELSDLGTGFSANASEITDSEDPFTIWQIEVTDGVKNDPADEGDLRRQIGGTITITLTLESAVSTGDSDGYLDTLTFSATLEGEEL